MEVRKGLVRRVSDGVAYVDIERTSGCGRCSESGGCGQACAGRPVTYAIRVAKPVSPGDPVQVVVPQRAPLVAAMMSYGVALFALLAGALLARAIAGDSDQVVAAGAAVGLGAAVFWMCRARPRASIVPVLTVVPDSSAERPADTTHTT